MAHAKQIFEGLQIILKYSENADVSAEHDIIYIGMESKVTDEEDQNRLTKLGWFYDDAYECYCRFV